MTFTCREMQGSENTVVFRLEIAPRLLAQQATKTLEILTMEIPCQMI